MMNLKCKISYIFGEFKKDKFAFVLKVLIYLFLILTVGTLPIFTGRPTFNYISIFFASIFSVVSFIYFVFKGTLHLNLIVTPFIIFLAYCLLSCVILNGSIAPMRSLVLIYGLSFVIYECTLNFSRFSLVAAVVYVLSSILLASFIFFENLDLILSLNIERIGDKYGNLNSIGMIFALSLCLSLYISAIKKKRRYLFFLLGLIDLLFAGLTGSRAAILISFCFIAIFSILLIKNKRKTYLIFVLSGVFVLIVLFLTLPVFESLRTRFLDSLISFLSGGMSGDASSNQRFAMFQEGIILFSMSPIFGNGFESFSVLSNQLVYSHSNFSEMLCNFGIIGSLIWFYPFYTSLRHADGRHAKFLVSFIVGVVFIGSFFTIFYSNRFFVLFTCIILGFPDSNKEISDIILHMSKKPYLQIHFSPSSFFKNEDHYSRL